MKRISLSLSLSPFLHSSSPCLGSMYTHTHIHTCKNRAPGARQAKEPAQQTDQTTLEKKKGPAQEGKFGGAGGGKARNSDERNLFFLKFKKKKKRTNEQQIVKFPLSLTFSSTPSATSNICFSFTFFFFFFPLSSGSKEMRSQKKKKLIRINLPEPFPGSKSRLGDERRETQE